MNEKNYNFKNLESLLDNLIEGFQLISPEWRYLYVNDAVVKQGKFKVKEDLLGYTMMEKYPGIENTDMFKNLQNCLEQNVSRRIENEFVFPDDSKGWFELRVEPVPEGLFILSMDITESKMASKVLEKKVQERTAEVKAQKSIIEEKNKNILESITYARRLQEAMMPSLTLIETHLPQSFVFYQPKDIVSGDFYWFIPPQSDEDHLIIAACDCTGHGVPGALVSVVCQNALNMAVRELNDADPGMILDRTCHLVFDTFQKNGFSVHDGMDISLISMLPDDDRVTIKWAGANNPLWYIEDVCLKEIEPDKQAIGRGYSKPRPFKTTTLSLKRGTAIYLFSDGFADQFGGLKNKKFTYKQLKEKLTQISPLTMDLQKKELEKTFNQWKSDQEQIDDVLVLGFRL